MIDDHEIRFYSDDEVVYRQPYHNRDVTYTNGTSKDVVVTKIEVHLSGLDGIPTIEPARHKLPATIEPGESMVIAGPAVAWIQA